MSAPDQARPLAETMPVEVLERLIEQGLSVREIAAGTGLSRSNLGYWRRVKRIPEGKAEASTPC